MIEASKIYLVMMIINTSTKHTPFLDGFFLLFGNHFLILNLTLGTSLESTDGFAELFVIIEVGSEGSSKVVDLSFVFLSNVSNGEDGGILLVDKSSEGSFSLNEAVWDIHLSAEVGEPNNKFDGIDVVSNHNQFSLLFLNKFGNMVETELNVIRLGVFNLFLFIM